MLAAISESLKREYVEQEESQWKDSPFAWILARRSSRQRGKIGEQLIAGWCAARDLNVLRSTNSDADRIIEGQRVEIKFSSLWSNGQYLFQQIRDQEYDYLLCLGISPFSSHAWIMKKSEIPFDRLKHQHGGSRGRDTWWLTVKPMVPPEWLGQFGGTLGDVLTTMKGFRKIP